MKLLAALATTTTLALAFATPIFTTPATAQSQSQCEPDHNGNVIDLGYSLEEQSSSIAVLDLIKV